MDTVADLPPAVPPAPAIDIDALLKDARAAAAAGQIIEPQGNNAVDIPKFDPLVAEAEQKIAELRMPKAVAYVIRKEKD